MIAMCSFQDIEAQQPDAHCLCLTALYQQTETVESLPASHVITAHMVVS
jgi:hypothetical protein